MKADKAKVRFSFSWTAKITSERSAEACCVPGWLLVHTNSQVAGRYSGCPLAYRLTFTDHEPFIERLPLVEVERLQLTGHFKPDRRSQAVLDETARAMALKRVNSITQGQRRKGKPMDDPADSSRDERLRSYHERLEAQGAADATSQTATEFNLSTRHVRRILRR